MKDGPFSPIAQFDVNARLVFESGKMMASRRNALRMTGLISGGFAAACVIAALAQSSPGYAAKDVPAPDSDEARKGQAPQDQAPTSTPSGWQLRAIAGTVSNPNPEHSSGTPFKEGADWHRYARVATISFDPPLAGKWGTTVKSVITVDMVVRLETRNTDNKKWTAVPGKPLFTSGYSRFVEARIDDAGVVTFDFDDGSPATDPEHHLAATIVPSATGREAVTNSGPHNGAAPYNLPPDTMNARCTFQKRKGPDGVPTDVPTDP